MENDVKSRFLQFLLLHNIKKAVAERQLGFANGYFSQVKNISTEKLNKILSVYPNLNHIWLLTGEGNMLNTPNGDTINATNNGTIGGDMNVAHTISHTEAIEYCEVEEIPVIPKGVCNEPNIDVLEYVQQHKVNTSPVVQQFPKSNVWYPVFTDAMRPDYLPGDKLSLLSYDKGKEEVFNNRVYVIDTYSNGMILCRLSKTENGYIAKYRNNEYPDDFIRMDDVIRIYRVVGLIRVIM